MAADGEAATPDRSRADTDAAVHAELATLRRRAYAADGDIAEDPAAALRLHHLEEQARLARAERAGGAGGASAGGASAGGGSGAGAGDAGGAGAAVAGDAAPSASDPAPAARVLGEAPEGRHPHGRPRWHSILVGSVAAVAVVLGMVAANAGGRWGGSGGAPAEAEARAAAALEEQLREALAFASDPQSTSLLQVNIDGYFSDFGDRPDADSLPEFPIAAPLWSKALGEYYGFDLWIGGTVVTDDADGADKQLCLLLVQPGETRSRCMDRAAWDQGAMLLPVAYADLDAAERPAEMSTDQSLGFWWTQDEQIRILLGRLG